MCAARNAQRRGTERERAAGPGRAALFGEDGKAGAGNRAGGAARQAQAKGRRNPGGAALSEKMRVANDFKSAGRVPEDPLGRFETTNVKLDFRNGKLHMHQL